MILDDIGFYTITERRAHTATGTSRLMRAELVVTDRCNFKCGYCKGLPRGCGGDANFDRMVHLIEDLKSHNLKTISFTGGEPTLYKGLPYLVSCAKGMDRIYVSTNGSSPWSIYAELISAGVTDFNVSLDASNADDGDEAAGGIPGIWARVVENIEKLSRHCRVLAGVVVTEKSQGDVARIAKFALQAGVHDVRITSVTQHTNYLNNLPVVDRKQWPVLSFRTKQAKAGLPVRGLTKNCASLCALALDEMTICNGLHFPCSIYLREKGMPIGRVGSVAEMRTARRDWVAQHNSQKDLICKGNCIDFYAMYNNKYSKYLKED